MKKSKQILRAEISSNGFISAYYADNTEVKLSRSARNAFANIPKKGRKYSVNSQEYIDNIIKVFGGNPEILSSDFTVYKDGEIKFTYTKTN